MYLTKEDIQVISDLLDEKLEQKLDEKLDQKLDEKLQPLRKDIADLKNSVDNLNVRVDRNTRKIEELNVTVGDLKFTCKRNFRRLQDGMDTVEEIFKMNDLIPG